MVCVPYNNHYNKCTLYKCEIYCITKMLVHWHTIATSQPMNRKVSGLSENLGYTKPERDTSWCWSWHQHQGVSCKGTHTMCLIQYRGSPGFLQLDSSIAATLPLFYWACPIYIFFFCVCPNGLFCPLFATYFCQKKLVYQKNFFLLILVKSPVTFINWYKQDRNSTYRCAI